MVASPLTLETTVNLLAELVPAIVWISDPNGQPTYFNQRLHDYTGLTVDAATNGGWLSIVHPDDAGHLADLWQHCLLTGDPYEVQCRYRLVDGRWCWFLTRAQPVRDHTGAVVRWFGITTEIDAQKAEEFRFRDIAADLRRAEEQARQARDELTLLFDNVSDYLALIEVEPNGRFKVVRVNRTFLEQASGDSGKVVGQYVDQILPEPGRQQVLKAYRQAIADRKTVTLQHETGTYVQRRFLETKFTPVSDGDGHVTHILAVGRDLTDRRRADDERQKLEDQLRLSQKTEAIGRLAGGIAHDFNNLLTVTQGFTALARSSLPTDHPVQAYLQQVERTSDRAATLTRQLLAYSQRQLLQPKVFQINSAVQEVGRMLERLLGAAIRLRLDLVEQASWVRLDPGQLQQVLINLAVNARDAMPQGGQLVLQTKVRRLVVPLSDAVHGLTTGVGIPPGDYVTLSVTDTGTGMEPDVRDRIFEPFYTTKPLGQGTGLGLPTVLGIVRQSGGFVQVHTAQGAGSCFVLWFPLMGPAEPSGPVVPNLPARGRGQTVLVAEDEEPVRMLIQAVLVHAGYQVVPAVDGTDAWKQLHDGGLRPDLLLTDVVMPGLSGRDLAERALTLLPGLPVLFVTGYTADTTLRSRLPEGADVLEKPFRPDRLLQRIAVLLEPTSADAGSAG